MNTAALLLLFNTISAQLDLPPNLLASLCYVETKHDVKAIHKDDGPSDSLGICQVKHSTAMQLGFKGTPADLMKPQNNILYAGKYLANQIKRYDGNVTRGIVAYNKGNAINLTRTTYSDKVLNHWKQVEAFTQWQTKITARPFLELSSVDKTMTYHAGP